MIPLPLALSLSSSLTKIGVVAAVAALAGVAILSLLSFSQARELRRLRDWAGRAPERAADRDQRAGEDSPAPVAGAPSAVQHVSPGVAAASIDPGPSSPAGPETRVPGAIPSPSVPGAAGQAASAQPAPAQSQAPAPAIAAAAGLTPGSVVAPGRPGSREALAGASAQAVGAQPAGEAAAGAAAPQGVIAPPGASSSPGVAAAPAGTPAPAGTGTPGGTAASGGTAGPGGTPAPAGTASPGGTAAPGGTAGPGGTAAPAGTPAPAGTAASGVPGTPGEPTSPGVATPDAAASQGVGAPSGDGPAHAKRPADAPATTRPPVPSVAATKATAAPGSASAHPVGSAPAVPATAAALAAAAGAGAPMASGDHAPPDPSLEPAPPPDPALESAPPAGPADEAPAPRDRAGEAPAPATVAARAAAVSRRAPVSVAAATGDGTADSPSGDGGSVATSAPPAGPPDSADRPLHSAPRHGADRLPPAPPPRRRGGATASSGRAEPVFASAPSPRRPARSPARARGLIVGGVLFAIAVLAVVLFASGSFNGKGAAQRTSRRSAQARHPRASAPPANPAEMHVVVLNGTNTTGLAHRLSASLQQSGYSQATALNGTPPGTHQLSVVEYAAGDRADAKLVAHALSVSQVQPLEASVATLAGGATVVVIAGLDKAGGAGEGGEAVP